MKKKWIKRIVLTVAALLIIIILIVALTLNGIVRKTVESVATQSVQQPTTLQAANLSVFGGTLGLSGLTIKNPTGYSSQDFVDLKQIDIAVQTSSLLGDTMVVNDLAIQDLHLNIEQSGLKNNLNDILSAIQKQREKNAGDSASSKQLKITKLTLKNTKVTLNLGLPGQAAQNVTVTIPEMVMNDPTNSDGRLMKAADLIGKVLVEVVVKAKDDVNIPPEIRNAINGALSFAGDNLKTLFNDFGKVGEGAATQAGKPVSDVIKGVGDLFKKDKDKK